MTLESSATPTPAPEEPRQIRVVIVDDHPAILMGLRSMLSEEDSIQVVATFESGAALEHADAGLLPEVVLLDEPGFVLGFPGWLDGAGRSLLQPVQSKRDRGTSDELCAAGICADAGELSGDTGVQVLRQYRPDVSSFVARALSSMPG